MRPLPTAATIGLLILMVGNLILMYANWYWASKENDIGNIGGMITSATVSILLLIVIAALARGDKR